MRRVKGKYFYFIFIASLSRTASIARAQENEIVWTRCLYCAVQKTVIQCPRVSRWLEINLATDFRQFKLFFVRYPLAKNPLLEDLLPEVLGRGGEKGKQNENSPLKVSQKKPVR